MKHLQITLAKRRNLLFGIVAMGSLALSLGSCKDEKSASEQIAGTYDGHTVATFAYSPKPVVTDGETVTITSLGDGKASLSLTSKTWGPAVVGDVTITSDGQRATLAGEGTIDIPSMGGKGKYDVILSGTVALDRSNADLLLKVPAVMGGVDIAFHTGAAPTEQ